MVLSTENLNNLDVTLVNNGIKLEEQQVNINVNHLWMQITINYYTTAHPLALSWNAIATFA